MGCGSSVVVSQPEPTIPEGKIPVETEVLDAESSTSKCFEEDTFTVNADPHQGFLPCYDPSALELKCRSTVARLVSSSSKGSENKGIEELIQFWKMSGQLADIEQYSLTTPQSLSTTTTKLSEYLTRSSCNYVEALGANLLHTQVAKAYCIYFWIANNIIYDNQLWQAYQSGDDESFEHNTQAEEVLKRQMTVSYGYANLFKSLATISGLKVEVVHGNIKNWKSQSASCFETEFQLSRKNIHAWNSITFEGVAYLVDCTLGSGHISPNMGYQSKFISQFFSVKPQDFIFTHWPSMPNMQLLRKSLSFGEFQPLIPLSPKALELGINPDTWSECLEIPAEVHDPVVSITMACDIDVKVLVKLSTKQGLAVSNELNSHVFVYREASSTEEGKHVVRIRAIVPDVGQYVLDVHACKTPVNSPDQNYHIVLSYQIVSKTNLGKHLKVGYPIVHELAAAAFDFQILHWNKPMPDYCCEVSTGELDIVFRANSNLHFYHYIVSSAQESECSDRIFQYNTYIAQNMCGDQGIYVLRCLFPCQGYWSVCLYATKAIDNDSQEPVVSGYTCIFKYQVYIKSGVNNKSFPRIIAPYITLNKPLAISASGNEVLSVPFRSSKPLDFRSYLTFEKSTAEPIESYTTVSEDARDIEGKVSYYYCLSTIFPKPGGWFIHILGKVITDCDQKYRELFVLNVNVAGALTNKRFPTIYSTIANSLKFRCCDTGSISFCDDGSPFSYSFMAPRTDVHFIPSISLENNDKSSIDETFLKQCTLLLPCITDTCDSCVYTMHAVFPLAGTWSVQLFGRLSNSELDGYNLVLYIQLQVCNPSPNRYYPIIYPAFTNLGLSIPNEHLLYDSEITHSEIKLPFYSPQNVLFDSRLVQGHDIFVNQAMVRQCGNHGGNCNTFTNYELHIIFPKTGNWVFYLYAGNYAAVQAENLQSETYCEKKAVFELKLTALCCNAAVSFPQIFDPFYSTFSLKLDEELHPLVSRVTSFPSRIVIPFYSPPDVVFWHNCKLSTNLETSPITRIESDQQTGLCKLTVEIYECGQWIVTLYAKRSDSPESQKWITVLKHTIEAL